VVKRGYASSVLFDVSRISSFLMPFGRWFVGEKKRNVNFIEWRISL
jgi:hypothetical protein